VNLDYANGIGLPWLIFAAYWIIARLRVNRMVRPEPAGEYLGRTLVMAAAFFLLYSNDPRFGLLDLRFVPEDYRAFMLGSAMTYAGVGFAIWARYHIAQYWSATVALRADHQLIRTGSVRLDPPPDLYRHAAGGARDRNRGRALSGTRGVRADSGGLHVEIEAGGEFAGQPVRSSIRGAPP
jgi:hypothetical protein